MYPHGGSSFKRIAIISLESVYILSIFIPLFDNGDMTTPISAVAKEFLNHVH